MARETMRTVRASYKQVMFAQDVLRTIASRFLETGNQTFTGTEIAKQLLSVEFTRKNR